MRNIKINQFLKCLRINCWLIIFNPAGLIFNKYLPVFFNLTEHLGIPYSPECSACALLMTLYSNPAILLRNKFRGGGRRRRLPRIVDS